MPSMVAMKPSEANGQASAVQKSWHNDETEECTLQFINKTGKTVSVSWLNFEGGEQEYFQLEPGHSGAQSTFTTHCWRVRLTGSGLLVGEYVGRSAVVEALGPGHCVSSPLDTSALVPQAKPEWGQYRCRGDALGVTIMAYDCVDDRAVSIASHLITRMLDHSPHQVVARLADARTCVAVIARCQVTTDIPEHWFMKLSKGGRDIDATTRGLGGTESCPLTSCGEENLLMEDDAHYPSENILIHEFGHTVMNVGLTEQDRQHIEQLYQTARAGGEYDLGCYAMENADEYWAEGCQAYFEATVRCDVNSSINTRAALWHRDPGLASKLKETFGDGPWRYHHDSPAPLSHHRRRAAKRPALDTLDGAAAQVDESTVAPTATSPSHAAVGQAQAHAAAAAASGGSEAPATASAAAEAAVAAVGAAEAPGEIEPMDRSRLAASAFTVPGHHPLGRECIAIPVPSPLVSCVSSCIPRFAPTGGRASAGGAGGAAVSSSGGGAEPPAAASARDGPLVLQVGLGGCGLSARGSMRYSSGGGDLGSGPSTPAGCLVGCGHLFHLTALYQLGKALSLTGRNGQAAAIKQS